MRGLEARALFLWGSVSCQFRRSPGNNLQTPIVSAANAAEETMATARKPASKKSARSPEHEAVPETPLGPENDIDTDDEADLIDEETHRPEIATHPRSEVTARHDEGSGANETVDGLDELQEAVRHGAEDIPA